MEKTLGGDRLGSGKKMKVHLHGYERSSFDIGYVWRSTMASGTLVPFLCEIATPGTTFDINLDAYANTHPTIGPLFGSFKMQLDVFCAPIRLYNSYLHNNAINIGRNMSTIKLPQIEMTALALDLDNVEDADNAQVNPSCLLAYLGIRGIGKVNTVDVSADRQFNAIPILAYWEIYKNYYANKQEEIGAVIHTPQVTIVTTVTGITIDTVNLPGSPGTASILMTAGSEIVITFSGTQPIPSQLLIQINPGGIASVEDLFTSITLLTATQLHGYFNHAVWGDTIAIRFQYASSTIPYAGPPLVATFPLEYIDDMRWDILSTAGTTPYLINTLNKEPYKWLYEQPAGIPNSLSNQEGLGIKTYQSDLFNNWLSTEWIDGTGGISEITSIDTSGGSFSIDTLNLSRKVYNMLNRIAVSGGSYNDWQDAVYDHDRYKQCESPMYMGGLIKELIFQEVISNSESTSSESGEQPLGTLAGKGMLSKKHKGGSVIVKVDEPSYVIGLVSLTPRIDYSQGNKWDVNLKTMDDLHKPALDEIGFQELITEQMHWADTEWDPTPGEWVTKSAGKQPAWINYMTNVNKTYGNFAIANNEMFMTLNRRYEIDEATGITDLTTYIDPSKYNNIFAQTSLDAQNFWVQIGIDCTARRKQSSKLMPNL